MSLTQSLQQAEVGVFIELFTLDVTSLGAGILYWTPSRPTADKPIIWRGHTYTSVDIKAEGFDLTAGGTLPRPQLTVGNADNLVGSLLSQYGDVLGCMVTRTRTLYDYLDDQPGADPDAAWPVDIFRVERKVSQSKLQVVLELATATDQAGVSMPGRVVLRDVCTLLYRRWGAGTPSGTFDYSRATCPYAGTDCFDRLGNNTTSPNDNCGKRISDCKLRFGAHAELPFGGFPGVARIR